MSGWPAQSVRPAPGVLRARAIEGRNSAAVESGNGFLLEMRCGRDSSRPCSPPQRAGAGDILSLPIECTPVTRSADMRLTGKVAMVAGATRGAGRGIAVQLGAAGATV